MPGGGMSGSISVGYWYRLLPHISAARCEHWLAVVVGSGVGTQVYGHLLLIRLRHQAAAGDHEGLSQYAAPSQLISAWSGVVRFGHQRRATDC